MADKPIIDALAEIQFLLHAPKNQFNSFGKYKYRNCEDILEAVKPLASERGCAVIISDEPVVIGGRHYIKATATLMSATDGISATACAMEAESKKGMDSAQVTGATSSYARKYALNGLFAIDDTKDADSKDNDKPEAVKPVKLITFDQETVIDELITSTGVDRVKFIKWMQVDKIEQLAAGNYDRIVAELEKRK
jgi:hypothetical protein